VDNVFSQLKKNKQLTPIFVIERKRNAMLGTLIKRRLSDNQVANVFVNALLEVVDNGFKEVAALINDDAAFVASPNISSHEDGEFALIVIVGNLSYLESTFEADQAFRVEKLIFEKLGKLYGMSEQDFTKLVREYQSFMTRVNHPSKNMIYAMSKAIFHKYNLNEYQDTYFRRLSAPNPLFLKRMDEVVGNFIWNWDSFFKKYKI
jgi:hypothetical protein